MLHRRLASILLVAIAVLTALLASAKKESKAARTETTVRREQTQTRRNIDDTQRRITENNREVSVAMNELNSVQAEIDDLDRQINDLSESISTLENLANVADDSISVLADRVEQLRADYARSVRQQRRHRKAMSDLTFIFSAESFRQGAERLRYLESVDRRIKQKAARLKEEIVELDKQRSNLASLRSQRQDAIALKSQAKTAQQSKLQLKEKVIGELRSENTRLRKYLESQQSLWNRLDRELQALLAPKPAKNTKDSKTTKPSKDTPPVSGPFEKNKGRMPMPLTGNYKIVSRFGVSTNPADPSVHIQNNGINLQGKPGAEALSVFDGTVIVVKRMSEYSTYYVVINHGNYSSAYAWIQSPAVTVNQKVKTGQRLGTVYYNSSDPNSAILHVEILRNASGIHEDPLKWIAK